MAMASMLKRVCDLQPAYSSSNTTEMQERGQLIRTELVNELRSRVPSLKEELSLPFEDLEVEGSDGIGRKTEAPWVRLYSKAMSPSAREGFYFVIHFAADGSACYFTLGCGSTVWTGGDLRPVSDSKLKERTLWARSILESRWGTLAPFTETMSLGARAPLPRTFEKATAIAYRIPRESLESADLDSLLRLGVERLAAVYAAQLDQRDLSPADQIALELDSIVRPLLRRGRAQGIGLNAKERKEVELRAMRLATEFLEAQGYACEDKSGSESYDLLARRGSEKLKVEVKGTTSELCDSILMTRNEIELHQKEKGSTALVIVYKINLSRSDDAPHASGGVVEALMNWDIGRWALEPVTFQVRRPT